MTTEAKRRLSRETWTEAALEAIAEGGIAAVAVVPLARRLGATKGSFYWHFDNRDELVAAALADWEQTHTSAVISEIDAASDDPRQQLRLLFKRVTELAARDRIELALLATADDPAVQRCSSASPADGSISPRDCSSVSASRRRTRSDGPSSPTAPTSDTPSSSTPHRKFCRERRRPAAPTSTTSSPR